MKTVKVGVKAVSKNPHAISFYEVQIVTEMGSCYYIHYLKHVDGPKLVNPPTIVPKYEVISIKEKQVSNWNYFWNYKSPHYR